MNAHQFEITATLRDESAVADAAVHLGLALAKAGDISLTATEESEALGMNRKEVILSIMISFTTSIAATAATDLIKHALGKVHTSAILQVDVSYDSALSSPGSDKKTQKHDSKRHASHGIKHPH